MELIDYLRAMGKRWLVLIIVPLIAGVVAVAIVYEQPREFRAKTTVRLPLPSDSPSSVITQANADFTQALTSQAVLDTVSKATGVSPGTIKHNLSVTQSGGSRILDVTYTAHGKAKGKKAPAIAEGASHAALENLLAPEVATQQKSVAAAQSTYNNAQHALDQFTAQTGSALPEDEYRQLLGTISQLQVQLIQAQATNGTTDAQGHVVNNDAAIHVYQQAIASNQAQVSRLKSLVSQARPLEDATQTAIGNLTTAQRNLQDAQAAQSSIDSPSTLITTPTTKVKTVPRLVKTIAVVVVVALVLSVVFLVLLELVRPSTRKDKRSGLASVPPEEIKLRSEVPATPV